MSENVIDANNVANWLVEKCNSKNYKLSENEVENLINLLKRNEFPSDAYEDLFKLWKKQKAKIKYTKFLFSIPPEQIVQYQNYIDFDKKVPRNYFHFYPYEDFPFFLAYLYQHKDEPESKCLLSKEFIAWQCVNASWQKYIDEFGRLRPYVEIPVNEQWELVKNFNENWNENFFENTEVYAKQAIFNYLRKEHYNELPDIANEKTILINFFELEELINFFPRINQETLLELSNSKVVELVDYFIEKESINCDQIEKMFYVIFNRENMRREAESSRSLKPEQFLNFITLCSKNVKYGKSKIELLKMYRENFEKWSNNSENEEDYEEDYEEPVLIQAINIRDIAEYLAKEIRIDKDMLDIFPEAIKYLSLLNILRLWSLDKKNESDCELNKKFVAKFVKNSNENEILNIINTKEQNSIVPVVYEEQLKSMLEVESIKECISNYLNEKMSDEVLFNIYRYGCETLINLLNAERLSKFFRRCIFEKCVYVRETYINSISSRGRQLFEVGLNNFVNGMPDADLIKIFKNGFVVQLNFLTDERLTSFFKDILLGNLNLDGEFKFEDIFKNKFEKELFKIYINKKVTNEELFEIYQNQNDNKIVYKMTAKLFTKERLLNFAEYVLTKNFPDETFNNLENKILKYLSDQLFIDILREIFENETKSPKLLVLPEKMLIAKFNLSLPVEQIKSILSEVNDQNEIKIMSEIAKISLESLKAPTKNKYKNLFLLILGLTFIGLAAMFILFGFGIGVTIPFAIGLGVGITSGVVGLGMLVFSLIRSFCMCNYPILGSKSEIEINSGENENILQNGSEPQPNLGESYLQNSTESKSVK